MSASEAVRSALRERVARKVAGSGISPRAIERAVDAVVASLPPEIEGTPAASSEVVVAIAARSVADLGSRVRAALEKDGLAVSEIAVASAGQHTVVTLRAPSAVRERIARIAEALQASFTILDAPGR